MGGAVGGVAYTATNFTTFDAQEALGAVAGGAVAGAVTAVAGPVGGSVASGLGFAASGVVASATTVGIGAVGGAAAAEVESLVGTGQWASSDAVLRSAALNGVGGYLGNILYRTVGIYTARQAALFGPHSWTTLFRGLVDGARNSRAILCQALISSGIGSLGYLK